MVKGNRKGPESNGQGASGAAKKAKAQEEKVNE